MGHIQHTELTFGAVAILAALTIAILAPASRAAQARQWKEFRSAEGNFAVLLPTQPSFEKKLTTTDLGPIEMQMFTSTTDNLYCSVAYYDVPGKTGKSPEQLLEDTCNGFLKGANLSEKAERRSLDLKGHPGREIIGEAQDGTFLLMARYYLVDDRIYLVMVGSAIEDASSPDIGNYFDSFRLLA